MTLFLIQPRWTEGSKENLLQVNKQIWVRHNPNILNVQRATTGARLWFDPKISASQVEDVFPIWDEALSCGSKLSRVQQRSDADVAVVCGISKDVAIFSFDDNLKIALIEGEDSSTIFIDEDLCNGGDNVFWAHVVGHALGFGHTNEIYHTLMDRQATTLIRTGEPVMSGIELDGFKLWSLDMGAPGCVNSSLSRDENPEDYSQTVGQ